MNFQITAAPTKEIAIGMKISDFAMLPHQIRSVSAAAIRPKTVESAGTNKSHRKLLKIDSRKPASPNIQRKLARPTKFSPARSCRLSRIESKTG